MDERVKKAFDFAADLTRQLITLSTAIIAAVVTFYDKTGQASLQNSKLSYSLYAYLISIVFGLLALMALTGTLGKDEQPDIYKTNIRLVSGLQIVFFLIATLLIILIGPPQHLAPKL